MSSCRCHRSFPLLQAELQEGDGELQDAELAADIPDAPSPTAAAAAAAAPAEVQKVKKKRKKTDNAEAPAAAAEVQPSINVFCCKGVFSSGTI